MLRALQSTHQKNFKPVAMYGHESIRVKNVIRICFLYMVSSRYLLIISFCWLGARVLLWTENNTMNSLFYQNIFIAVGV